MQLLVQVFNVSITLSCHVDALEPSAVSCLCPCSFTLFAPPPWFLFFPLHRLLQESKQELKIPPAAGDEQDDEEDAESIAAAAAAAAAGPYDRPLGLLNVGRMSSSTLSGSYGAGSPAAAVVDTLSAPSIDCDNTIQPSTSGRQGCPVFVMLPLDTVWVVERDSKKVR